MILDYWLTASTHSSSDSPEAVEEDRPLSAEAIFCAHAPRVFNLACRILKNDLDAEDVTQDVLLQVIRKLDTFRGEAGLTTWLHRVTVNAALMHRRKQGRLHERHVRVSFDAIPNVCESTRRRWSCPAPDQQALELEARELIDAAIARLPEKYRDVFVLADVEELSNADIGRLLGLGIPAVKSRLHRARLMMREALPPHFSPLRQEVAEDIRAEPTFRTTG
jgi:RNA polymerase sigma-70 factor (ECF subfamily)